jgi:hypothetical protein
MRWFGKSKKEAPQQLHPEDPWDYDTTPPFAVSVDVRFPVWYPWPKKQVLDLTIPDTGEFMRLSDDLLRHVVNNGGEARFNGYLFRYDPLRNKIRMRIDPVRLTPWLLPASIDVRDF